MFWPFLLPFIHSWICALAENCRNRSSIQFLLGPIVSAFRLDDAKPLAVILIILLDNTESIFLTVAQLETCNNSKGSPLMYSFWL